MLGPCEDDRRFGLIVRACVDVHAHRRLCTSCGWWGEAVPFRVVFLVWSSASSSLRSHRSSGPHPLVLTFCRLPRGCLSSRLFASGLRWLSRRRFVQIVRRRPCVVRVPCACVCILALFA